MYVCMYVRGKYSFFLQNCIEIISIFFLLKKNSSKIELNESLISMWSLFFLLVSKTLNRNQFLSGLDTNKHALEASVGIASNSSDRRYVTSCQVASAPM